MNLTSFPKVRTRIAPSPTGNLHLGTVRTALYNVLFSKKHDGDFFFRLEDTDRERSETKFTEEILEGFKWLGIKWDKAESSSGELIGLGDDLIVRQSLREAVHQSYIERLINEGKAYRCFATLEELEAMREAQRAKKEIERYDNRSRSLSKEDSETLLSSGKAFVVRLNLGEDHIISWNDLIRGEVSINTKDLGGDPVIQKSSGQILYNFAVVIDDYEMQVSHILRGEDHISNTAKQIAIYEALDFPIPAFAHLPLIFTKDKQKLSKRKHGDIASVETYRRQGYLAEALVNYLIGTSYNSAKYGEVFDIASGAEDFDISSVSKSPAIYDIQKLNWYNREYISRLTYEEFLEYCVKFSRFKLIESSLYSPLQIKQILESVRESIDKFEQIDEHINYFFEDISLQENPELMKIIDEGQAVLEKLLDKLETSELDYSNEAAIKEIINTVGENLNLKGKKLFFPIRAAISAKTSGPELGLIAVLLGKENFLQRLRAARVKIST